MTGHMQHSFLRLMTSTTLLLVMLTTASAATIKGTNTNYVSYLKLNLYINCQYIFLLCHCYYTKSLAESFINIYFKCYDYFISHDIALLLFSYVIYRAQFR